jgi:hypothetical protein
MNWQLTHKATPVILYFRSNESVTVSGIDGYSFTGRDESLYESCWLDPPTCILRVTEWGRTYRLQAIELVNWDTGEVYASVNQTSVTFNINANTIVRFKYVMTESWSRSWEVILPPKTPEPKPDECQRILNDPSTTCSREWCNCLRIFDNEAWRNTDCCQSESCYKVSINICCLETSSTDCATLSGGGGRVCKRIPAGATDTITVSWSISWSVKPGWKFDDIRRVGDGKCEPDSLTGSSASGTCFVIARPNTNYYATLIVIFKEA